MSANPITDALREAFPSDDRIGTDHELLLRLLHGASTQYADTTHWSNISRATGHGSGYSSVICRAIGLDPNEIGRHSYPDHEDEEDT